MTMEERERRLAEKLDRLGSTSGVSLSGLSKDRPAPLTPMQRQIWFAGELEPGRPLYDVCMARRIRGELDAGTLESALGYLVQRHEVLRTVIRRTDDGPVQVIEPFVTFELEHKDRTTVDAADRASEESTLIREATSEPQDVESTPPFSARLIRFGPKEHLLLIKTHHLVVDGWSKQLFWSELRIVYDAMMRGLRPELPQLSVSFADYAVWLDQTKPPDGDGTFWSRQLAGIEALDLPLDRPRPTRPSYDGMDLHFSLDAKLVESVASVARQEESTLFAGLLSAFHVLLYRYSGQKDITVGCPVAGRDRQEVEGLLGCFINTLPCRLDLSGGASFRDIVRRERRTILDALSHRNVPFVDIVKSLDTKPDRGRHAVYQTLFQLATFPQLPVPDDALDWSEPPPAGNPALLDLSLTLIHDGVGGLNGHLVYDTTLFDRESAEQMMSDYVRILRVMVEHPESGIDAFPLVSAAEVRRRSESRTRLNDGLPCVHRTFERLASVQPDAVAIIAGERELTYSELNARADRLADRLVDLGVSTEALVGVCMDRSEDLVAAILAILKAGGAFVPLDPAYPPDRLNDILRSAKPELLITEERHAPLFRDFDGELVFTGVAGTALPRPDVDVEPGHLAYVIHTSGSTGRPKGVMIEHGSLAGLAHAASVGLELRPSDRIMQFASISFDVAVQEIFETLTSGATLVLRMDGMIDSVTLFMEACRVHGITHLHLPTAYWHELTLALADGRTTLPGCIRCVEIGGEKARPDVWAAWRKAVGPSVRLMNGYGPTETSVTATAADLTDIEPLAGREVPIGFPMPHVRTYVLDAAGNSVPVGVLGELWIGGVGIARGYLNDPEQTAERFVERELKDGRVQRLYRTGDRVRYLRDGQLEFMGRIDRQVQVRGFRVEPGEIEAALLDHPSVRDAVVVDRQDVSGNTQLLAYVVPADEEPRGPVIGDHLRNRLPDFMIPAHIVSLNELPLSSNGKIDRAALPAPEPGTGNDDAGLDLPSTPHEQTLAGIWTELLNIETVHRDDNFFDLGGHSLLAIRIIAEVKRRMGVDLPLRTVFDAPTLSDLALEITQRSAETSDMGELDRLLTQLDGLTDAEVRRMLDEEDVS